MTTILASLLLMTPIQGQPAPRQLPLSTEAVWARRAEDMKASPLPGGGLRLVHTGSEDWAIRLLSPMTVAEGEAWRVTARIRKVKEGPGYASLSFVVRQGESVSAWTAGASSNAPLGSMGTIEAIIVAGRGVTSLEPRLVGVGPGEFEIASASLISVGKFALLGSDAAPLAVSNNQLTATFRPSDGGLSVLDKRTGRTWKTEGTPDLLLQTASVKGRSIVVEGRRMAGLEKFTLTLELSTDRPELSFRLESQGPLAELDYPPAFLPAADDSFIVPENMGIEMPASDPRFKGFWLPGFGGHGLCMAFWAQSSPKGTAMTIVEDPDDFLLVGSRGADGLLRTSPRWIGEKRLFSYPRRLRWVFLTTQGHQDVARRYREHARSKGLVVTLSEKAKKNPNVARMARAANFWHWGEGQGGFAKEVYDAGLRGLLWSGGGKPEDLKAQNSLGFITSRYDIFQDVMDPAKIPQLPWVHGGWVQEAWPQDLVRLENGDWEKGWVVQDKEGKDVACGVVCDKEAVKYAKKRIPEELKTHPYEARFIDTTTASPWRECWDPKHPMTRRESRKHKMELLQAVTDLGLVCGSETGHEASVPHLVFFEGMMSLGPYRVDDAGTNPPKVYDQLPEKTMVVQLGPKYRIPLWQMVYGDCTVSGWYWGDFNNKHLGTWKTRDLWNCLYGTPAMYFTDPGQFRAHGSEFVRSWTMVDKAQKATAMSLMTDHRFLTKDRTVQQSVWSNGARVTVNFGEKAFQSGEIRVSPMSCVVDKLTPKPGRRRS